MKVLLNSLFITIENAYASLDGENVVVKQKDDIRNVQKRSESGIGRETFQHA